VRPTKPLFVLILVVAGLAAASGVGPDGWRWTGADPDGWRWSLADPTGWRWD